MCCEASKVTYGVEHAVTLKFEGYASACAAVNEERADDGTLDSDTEAYDTDESGSGDSGADTIDSDLRSYDDPEDEE